MRSTLLAFVLTFAPVAVAAQMTVGGRVTIGDVSLQGATVAIPSLNLETRTNSDGVYNILVRAAQVRGQAVELVALHRRFGRRSVSITLTGGSLVHNFTLDGERPAQRPPVTQRPDRPGPGDASSAAVPATRGFSRTLDSTAFTDIVGGVDVVSALAGRIPGLVITGASTLGGTSLMLYRGPRSLSASAQPLVIVDGVPVDNSPFPSGPAQQFGLGGFDYGSALQGLALDDIATVTLLATAEATPLYGSRAANGVLVITTKRASGTGLQYSARARYTGQRPGRLPAYQNRFGQGLAGEFEFFDGQGGGINDAIDQSWGPALDGQPIPQASLTEARRPDVRYWLPHRSGVSDYLDGGSSLDVNASVQAARGANLGRASLTASDQRGLTPNASARRIGIALNGSAQPTPRLTGSANLQVTSTRTEDRPGTGFDEINPISGFTRMGRQVDLDELRSHVRDDAGEPLNWIYTTRNNPYFQSLENSNHDTRSHLFGGASLTYSLSPVFSATLHAASDDEDAERDFGVASGWLSGYPTALGRADFLGGGTQRQSLSVSDRTVGIAMTAAPTLSGMRRSGPLGYDRRSSEFDVTSQITTGAHPGVPAGEAQGEQSGSHSLDALYLIGVASRGSWVSVNAGVRVEMSSTFQDALGAAVFPSFSLTYDAAQIVSRLRELGLGTARVRASWWRAGNEVTTRTLSMGFVGGAAASPVVGIPGAQANPERTSGIELGGELATLGNRLELDVRAYAERSSELVVGTLAGQPAKVSNRGFETQLRATPFSTAFGSRWDVVASVARNRSTVDALGSAGAQFSEALLGPSLWGANLVARPGHPLGAIVGSKYLRDATGQLMLTNGLPVADGSQSVLGSWQPDWTASLQSRLRLRGIEVAVLLDGRMGGKVFSATNLWGSYAGTLESTVDGRDGMVLPGIDAANGAPNAVEVTAEDYFHSLAAIHEAWVFDASYAKLREARISYELPLTFLPGFRSQVGRLSLTARNLLTLAKAPNIDPEAALSPSIFQGFEMGQLPGAKSIGLVLSVTP